LTSKTKVALIGIDAAIPTWVQKYFKMGKLPNLERLAKEGTWAECLPVFPTHTAANWNSVVTGAYPKTHGVTDMTVHIPGTPLTEIKSGFYSDLCRAEQVYKTAENANKKCILLKYIASWPPIIKNGIQVEGFGAPGGPGSRPWGSSPLAISNSSCFSTHQFENSITIGFSRSNISEWNNSPVQSSLLPPLESEIKLGLGTPVTYKVLLLAQAQRLYDTVYITKSKNDKGFILKKNQFSDWLKEDFRANGETKKAAFRMKLIDIGGSEKEVFKLFISQIFPLEGWTYPGTIAKELVDRFGPFVESISHFPYVFGWVDDKTYLEDLEYQAKWLGNATKYLMSSYDWDLYLTQWHGIDNTQHAFVRFDKDGLTEDESKNADSVVLRSYEIADELVGDILQATKESNKGEDVYTIVLSDHGHVMGKRRFFINSYLYQNGLIKLKRDAATQKITVDWENTQAFAQGMISVYVNLKGRDPNGCVSPGREYDETVEKIIGLLYDLKDPKTGLRPISLALSNKHAEVIGLSGERVGDIVFAAHPIYAGDNRLELKEGLFADLKVGLYGGSIHGAQLPTVDLGEHGTIKSMFIAHGPKIRKSYVREKPINIVDVAPTISYMLNIPPPKDAEGKVIHDLFE